MKTIISMATLAVMTGFGAQAAAQGAADRQMDHDPIEDSVPIGEQDPVGDTEVDVIEGTAPTIDPYEEQPGATQPAEQRRAEDMPPELQGTDPLEQPEQEGMEREPMDETTGQDIQLGGDSPAQERTMGSERTNMKPAADGVKLSELDQSNVEQLQAKLQEQGFYKGDIDGVYGPETKQALRRYFRRQAQLVGQDQLLSSSAEMFGIEESEVQPVRGVEGEGVESGTEQRQPLKGESPQQEPEVPSEVEVEINQGKDLPETDEGFDATPGGEVPVFE